jgi:Fe-S cluster biogenesis protein NfuA
MQTLNTDQLLFQQVEDALQTVRPYLQADGGDLRLLNISAEGVANIELIGSCVTCPMSAMTMKAGVEQAVLTNVPAIKAVVAVSPETSGAIDVE